MKRSIILSGVHEKECATPTHSVLCCEYLTKLVLTTTVKLNRPQSVSTTSYVGGKLF